MQHRFNYSTLAWHGINAVVCSSNICFSPHIARQHTNTIVNCLLVTTHCSCLLCTYLPETFGCTSNLHKSLHVNHLFSTLHCMPYTAVFLIRLCCDLLARLLFRCTLLLLHSKIIWHSGVSNPLWTNVCTVYVKRQHEHHAWTPCITQLLNVKQTGQCMPLPHWNAAMWYSSASLQSLAQWGDDDDHTMVIAAVNQNKNK